jgi:kinesin family protein 11
LQEALGGRCKTVIIATISPSIINLQESLQTLHYAQTANGIKNKPVSNSYMSMAMSSTVSLLPSDGTVPMAAERWQEMEIRMEHMQQEVEEARHALARNYMQQQEMKERAEKAELELHESEYRLDVATNTNFDIGRRIEPGAKGKGSSPSRVTRFESYFSGRLLRF